MEWLILDVSDLGNGRWYFFNITLALVVFNFFWADLETAGEQCKSKRLGDLKGQLCHEQCESSE